MRRRRKVSNLNLTDDQRAQLQSLAQSTSMPHALVLPAKIVLACAEGVTNVVASQRRAYPRPRWGSGGSGFSKRVGRVFNDNQN